MSDLSERLRQTTQQMASACSVDMELWDRHSNICLEAAAEIERLRLSLGQEVKLRQSMAKILSEQSDRPIGIRPGKRRAIRRTGDPE